MDIETIQQRIKDGNYLVKSHALIHALKEGFERQHIVEAVLDGKIIEEYPNDERVLICGQTILAEDVSIYLHIVCEHADPVLSSLLLISQTNLNGRSRLLSGERSERW